MICKLLILWNTSLFVAHTIYKIPHPVQMLTFTKNTAKWINGPKTCRLSYLQRFCTGRFRYVILFVATVTTQWNGCYCLHFASEEVESWGFRPWRLSQVTSVRLRAAHTHPPQPAQMRQFTDPPTDADLSRHRCPPSSFVPSLPLASLPAAGNSLVWLHSRSCTSSALSGNTHRPGSGCFSETSCLQFLMCFYCSHVFLNLVKANTNCGRE